MKREVKHLRNVTHFTHTKISLKNVYEQKNPLKYGKTISKTAIYCHVKNRGPNPRRTRSLKKLKMALFLTPWRSQKHYVIFSNNVLRENITRKQLGLETIEIA